MKKEKIDYKKEKRLKKRLEREADNLWHQAVIKKWGDTCFFHNSGKEAKQHQEKTKFCHHYFPKGLYPILRFEISNGVPCCWSCHYKCEKIDRSMLADILIKRGKVWYNKLLKLSRQKKFSFQTVDYYKKQIKKLTNLLKDN